MPDGIGSAIAGILGTGIELTAAAAITKAVGRQISGDTPPPQKRKTNRRKNKR